MLRVAVGYSRRLQVLAGATWIAKASSSCSPVCSPLDPWLPFHWSALSPLQSSLLQLSSMATLGLRVEFLPLLRRHPSETYELLLMEGLSPSAGLSLPASSFAP